MISHTQRAFFFIRSSRLGKWVLTFTPIATCPIGKNDLSLGVLFLLLFGYCLFVCLFVRLFFCAVGSSLCNRFESLFSSVVLSAWLSVCLFVSCLCSFGWFVAVLGGGGGGGVTAESPPGTPGRKALGAGGGVQAEGAGNGRVGSGRAWRGEEKRRLTRVCTRFLAAHAASVLKGMGSWVIRGQTRRG